MLLYQYPYLFRPVLKSSPHCLLSFPILYQMMLLSQQMRREQMTDPDWKRAEQWILRRQRRSRQNRPDKRATQSHHYHRKASAARTTLRSSSNFSWQVLYCHRFLPTSIGHYHDLPVTHTVCLWWYRLHYYSSYPSLSLWWHSSSPARLR